MLSISSMRHIVGRYPLRISCADMTHFDLSFRKFKFKVLYTQYDKNNAMVSVYVIISRGVLFWIVGVMTSSYARAPSSDRFKKTLFSLVHLPMSHYHK